MNQEQWKQVKEIFHQASELPVEERHNFLDKACADNSDLRRQVDELLAAYESRFLEETVLPKVVEAAGRESTFKEGQVITHYQIKKILGRGGMGEVFLAEDTELNRPVAFKVLPPEEAEDKDRIQRFIREARAASALNHPNILTIHEIGKFEDSRFIVSEFVNGETLRERMKREPSTIRESLKICEQIAAALSAAHEAGIVHRDIKPENIMLRKDGLVKVLDFGLAKLIGFGSADLGVRNEEKGTLKQSPPKNPPSEFPNPKLTNPGVIMGTVAYMSPEQASGGKVDSRTDIWSLGVVFYEMLTGRLPFHGETTAEIIASILKTEAEALENLNPEITPAIRAICLKALKKNVRERYQSTQQFLEEIKGERKRMESIMEQTAVRLFNSNSEQDTELIRVPPTLSAEYIVTSVKRHKLAVLSSLLLVTVLAVGVTFYNFNAAPQPGKFNGAVQPLINAETTEKDLKFSRLPTSGQVIEIAISPDGKYIAYVTTIDNKPSIRIRQTDVSNDVELVPARSEGRFQDLSFTPDSNYLYYLYNTPNNEEIFKVPVQGGTPAKIADQTDGGGSISPDGKTLAFNRDQDQAQLVVLANPDGSNQRTLIKTPHSGNWIHCGGVPAWSTDGQKIACGISLPEGNERYFKLLSINVADGSQQTLSEHKWAGAGRAVWMPDGNLLISGREKSTGSLNQNSQIWLIAPGAAPKRVTNDPNNYSNISATAKGDVLVMLQSRMMTDLWTLPISGDALQAKQITFTGEIDGNSGWTPSGQIVFRSGLTNQPVFWIMNPDGTNRKQLTTNEAAGITAPKGTADGQYIIFNSNRGSSSMQVFRMNPDGSNVKQLTTGGLGIMASKTSPDGKWVYYLQVLPDQTRQIRKVSIDGGEPVSLVTFPDDRKIVNISIGRKSGRIAYFQRLRVENRWIRKIFITSPEGGEPLKTLELPPSEMEEAGFHWMPDEQALAFRDSRQGIANVWTISVDTGEVKQLTNFTGGQNFNFDFSWDGKQMLISRGLFSSEAVMISRAE